MRDSLLLYFRYLGVLTRSRLQYRTNFFMMAVAQFLVTGVELTTILVLFQRFASLRGWTLAEVALFYGLVNVSFALAEALGRGFDRFYILIRGGDFDRILLRPRSPVLQVAALDLALFRVGRLIQGLLVLIWAATALHVAWTPLRVTFLTASVVGGACFFIGAYVLQATLTFWTVESIEVFNIITNGGVQAAQFPLAIYRRWYRLFFTFVVPLACVAYFPGLALLGRSGGIPLAAQWLGPLVGPAFLLVALQVFKLGVRHYRSTGS